MANVPKGLQARRERNRKAAKKYRAKKRAQLIKVTEGAQDLATKALENAPRSREAVLVATFAGLTIGYKFGLIDIMQKIMPDLEDGFKIAAEGFFKALTPIGFNIPLGIFFDVTDTKPESVEAQYQKALEVIKKGEEDLASEQRLNNKTFMEGGKPLEDFQKSVRDIAKNRERLRDFEIKLRVFWAQYQNKLWAIAMGFAGITIYFAQENTLTEVVDTIPLTG